MLVALLVSPFAKSNRVEVVKECVIDTLLVYRVDTITQTKVEYVTKIVKDTLYIKDSASGIDIQLPIVQKYFSEPNRYDLWISGVEPLNVDKINVYNQVEYRTINNTTTKEVYVRRNEFYFGGGFYAISNTFAPIVGVSFKTKRNLLISLDYGRYDKGNVWIGTMKFKLGNNK